MLDSITLYVGSYLSEIGDTFGRLVACINSADKPFYVRAVLGGVVDFLL